MADLKAKVSFLADTKGLLKGVDAVEGRFNKLGRSLQTHSGAFLRAGAAMGAALGGLAVQGVAYGTTIDRMAESTGQAHEEMSRLVYSAELYHGSAEMVEKGVKSLAQKMQYAKDGMATYRREFERAGIDVDAWGDKMPAVNDMILELADSFAANADGTEVLASATVLLGGRQAALIPFMKQGSDVIREQFEEAEKLGLVLDSKTAKSMEAMGTSVKKLRIAMRGVGVVVATAVLPVVEDLAFKAIAAMMAFQEWTPEAKKATVETVAMGAGGLIAAGILGKLALTLKGLGVSGGAALTGLGAGLGGLAVGLGAFLGGKKLDEVLVKPLLDVGRAGREVADANVRFTEAQAALSDEMERTGMSAAEYDARLMWLYRDIYQNIEGAQNFEGVLDGTAAAIGETGEETDKLAVFLDKIKTAFDEAAGGAEDAAAPFNQFMEAIGLGVKPLEDFTVLMERLGFGVDITAEAMATIAEPLAYMGETINALPDPEVGFGEKWLLAGEMAGEAFLNINESMDAMRENMEATLPRAAKSMVKSFGRVYSELGSLDKMTWKTMKKAAAMGLKSMLDMVIDATLGKLLAKKIEAIADLGMQAFTNPAALAYIGVVAGIYGTAKAAISGINSFDESATITRGGSMTGAFSIGDTIISPDAMKNLMKGNMGGTTITVNANFNGVYGGDESDFQRDADSLVEAIELAMER